MKLITKQSLIDDIADRWDTQFGSERDPKSISYKLRALVNPTSSKINTIIGNDSWSTQHPYCDECDTVVDTVVEVGEDLDYDSATAEICVDCLLKAVGLIK